MWRRAARLRYCLTWLLAWGLLVAPGCGSGESAPPPRAASAAPVSHPVVLFLGTSLTAGYGLVAEQAFPALLGRRMQEAGLDYRVVNAGVSGDTSAGGLRRIDWLLRQPIEVLVLELGANDMLRGLDPDALARNLREIIARTRAAHPEVRVLVAGMRAAPNLGRAYAERFESVYPELARSEGAALVPFVLEGVAGRRRLNQADGIHPTAEGQRRIAELLWPALRPLLDRSR